MALAAGLRVVRGPKPLVNVLLLGEDLAIELEVLLSRQAVGQVVEASGRFGNGRLRGCPLGYGPQERGHPQGKDGGDSARHDSLSSFLWGLGSPYRVWLPYLRLVMPRMNWRSAGAVGFASI
jgi:hypothetical protein